MNHPSTSRALAAAALVSGTVASVTPAASADTQPPADVPPEEHCVVHVLGQEEGGRFITDEPTCYPTLAEALADATGFVPGFLSQGSGDTLLADVVAQSDPPKLAKHFDGANQSGSSIIVSGIDCNGGYVNLSSSWINRISSAINYCPNVNYYDGFDKAGTPEFTPGYGNQSLSTLNNAANSVGYA